ncbi:CGGC domain-containing protein [Candidatus Desantisbacteria bacterium]|nr:CGGC domain-containing protein [Candidatus Desantisbacteria bacterium]
MIKLIAIVQCHIVHERCPGYFCDRAFVKRTWGFEGLDLDNAVRKLSFTCGGCCGRALHRKLILLKKKAKQHDSIEDGEILVKLGSCISKNNYHGPVCPHLNYIKELIQKTGLAFSCDTHISKKAEAGRTAGIYKNGNCEE